MIRNSWQGNNLVLARKALLYTFIGYYKLKFSKKPLKFKLERLLRFFLGTYDR